MSRIVILEAVFDDSDIQVDYFSRDRPLKEWFVCELEGKVVTEAKLRKALEKLPAWLQAFKWGYEKPEKYSMSDHYYGQLRMDEGTGLSVTKPLTYSSETRGVGFILSTHYSLESWKANYEIEPLPQSIEEIRRFIEEKQRKEEERLNDPERKLRIAKAHADTIAQSTAVIDGRGFHVLTEQDKKEEIAKVVQKFAPAINEVEQKEEFCSCGVPKRLCIQHSKPKTGRLTDYF